MTGTTNHLRTDHLVTDLALHAARGSVVTLVAQAMKFVAGVTATMVLARILGPDDFGLAAMALATVGVLARIKDAGLYTVTVQSRDIVQEQATALFWMSLALATAAALLTLILAPAVGWFYRDPRLVPITAALALVPLLDGVTLQLQAVMTRQMRLVALSVADAATMAVGVAAAIALAWAGAGYWAIVGQELVLSAAYALVMWTVCRWRPGPPRRRSDVRPMVAFGLHLSGSRIVTFLTMNLDTVFVGRFRGALQAGIYDRAFRLLTIPLTLFNQPLTAVAVPALSRLQGDPERYRVFYRAWIRLMFGMSMPLVAFLFVDAERAVVTILGSQWMGIVPLYRVLAPAAFIGRLSMVTSWVYFDRTSRSPAPLEPPAPRTDDRRLRRRRPLGGVRCGSGPHVRDVRALLPGCRVLLPVGSRETARRGRRDGRARGGSDRSRPRVDGGHEHDVVWSRRGRTVPPRSLSCTAYC